jgi:hypothetical protein
MNEVGYPPKYYEINFFDNIEMKKIYKKYNIDKIINLIKKDS